MATVVQHVTTGVPPSIGNPSVINLTSTAEGNAIVVAVLWFDQGETTQSITDSGSGTYTSDADLLVTGDNWHLDTHSRFNIPSGITSVTVDYEQAFGAISVWEISGLSDALIAEDTDASPDQAQTSTFSISMDATNADSFYVGFLNQGNVSTVTGFTISSFGDANSSMLYGIAPNSGTNALTGTLASSVTGIDTLGVVYGAEAEGGGGVIIPQGFNDIEYSFGPHTSQNLNGFLQ